MTDTDKLLDDRERTSGNYPDNARITWDIVRVLESGRNWTTLPAPMRLSLFMFAFKMHRIVNGDPTLADHWDDIAGYAKLIPRSGLCRADESKVGKISVDELETILALRAGTATVQPVGPTIAQRTMARDIRTERTFKTGPDGKDEPFAVGDRVYVRGGTVKWTIVEVENDGFAMVKHGVELRRFPLHYLTFARGGVLAGTSVTVSAKGNLLPNGTAVKFFVQNNTEVDGIIVAAEDRAGDLWYTIEYQPKVGPRRQVTRPEEFVTVVVLTPASESPSAKAEPPDPPDYTVDEPKRYRRALTFSEYQTVGGLIDHGSRSGHEVRSLYERVPEGENAPEDHYVRLVSTYVEEYGL